MPTESALISRLPMPPDSNVRSSLAATPPPTDPLPAPPLTNTAHHSIHQSPQRSDLLRTAAANNTGKDKDDRSNNFLTSRFRKNSTDTFGNTSASPPLQRHLHDRTPPLVSTRTSSRWHDPRKVSLATQSMNGNNKGGDGDDDDDDDDVSSIFDDDEIDDQTAQDHSRQRIMAPTPPEPDSRPEVDFRTPPPMESARIRNTSSNQTQTRRLINKPSLEDNIKVRSSTLPHTGSRTQKGGLRLAVGLNIKAEQHDSSPYNNFNVQSQQEPDYAHSASDFYRRSAGPKTDLRQWQPPTVMPQTYKTSQLLPITNLPDWSTLRGSDPTAYPISHVQRDVEYSMMRLLSPAVFEQFMNDPLGRHRFREYLKATGDGNAQTLDFMLDLRQHMRAISDLKNASEAIHDVYVAEDSEDHIELPRDLNRDLLGSLRSAFTIEDQLSGVHSHLVQTLFNSAFQHFIRASITEQSRVRLGAFGEGENDGLGAAFVITNPRLRDHPIVLVSDEFCQLSGYPREAILQRNCRFLQGPSTSPAAVQRIRDALNAGMPSVELLLNYKRSGEPFFNLLTILPLRDVRGSVQYFVGGQVSVTGSLKNRGLSFLLGGDKSSEHLPDPSTTMLNGVEASPTLLRHYSPQDGGGEPNPDEDPWQLADRGSIRRGGGRAAGSQASDYDGPTAAGSAGNLTQLPSGGIEHRSRPAGNGFMKRFRRSKSSKATSSPASQLLGKTVETEGPRTGGTLDDHVEDFVGTYSKLALVRREKREVLFVTPTLLEFFDLPTNTHQQVYDSPLLHTDVLSLICGQDRNETKRIRVAVQNAIRHGQSLKIPVDIRQPSRGIFGSSQVLKSSVLHVAPLRDVENSPFATIIVFS
ncbi:hypothetical protein OC861_005462 [Tilletia horrida]|nr:hypothetical protein OC861_005462 [Tilletia horrida]